METFWCDPSVTIDFWSCIIIYVHVISVRASRCPLKSLTRILTESQRDVIIYSFVLRYIFLPNTTTDLKFMIWFEDLWRVCMMLVLSVARTGMPIFIYATGRYNLIPRAFLISRSTRRLAVDSVLLRVHAGERQSTRFPPDPLRYPKETFLSQWHSWDLFTLEGSFPETCVALTSSVITQWRWLIILLDDNPNIETDIFLLPDTMFYCQHHDN